LSASTSLATVEKVGPSSEAKRCIAGVLQPTLIVLSGIGFVFQVADVRAVRFEPSGVSIAGFALPKWPALIVSVYRRAWWLGCGSRGRGIVPTIRR
jgi:hypothetical protein